MDCNHTFFGFASAMSRRSCPASSRSDKIGAAIRRKRRLRLPRLRQMRQAKPTFIMSTISLRGAFERRHSAAARNPSGERPLASSTDWEKLPARGCPAGPAHRLNSSLRMRDPGVARSSTAWSQAAFAACAGSLWHPFLLAQSKCANDGGVVVESSLRRSCSGLMGLSDIAKAPVSHGVEPHDFQRGPGLRVPAYREREDLTGERRSIVNKIDGILTTLGVKGYKALRRDRREQLTAVRRPDGDPIPQKARARIERLLVTGWLLLSSV